MQGIKPNSKVAPPTPDNVASPKAPADVELDLEQKNIDEQEKAFHDQDEMEDADIVIDLDLT